MSGDAIFVVMENVPRAGYVRYFSHVAEKTDGSLRESRDVALAMKISAASHAVTLKFSKILRASKLVDWAESNCFRVSLSAGSAAGVDPKQWRSF